MTQLRCGKDSISNLLDQLEAGIGHRGSSFSDIDAISHDGRTHRFLVRELKRSDEELSEGQRRLLCDLALEQRFTVWYLKFVRTDVLAWADMLQFERSSQLITREHYREMLAAWWSNRYDIGRYVELDQDIYLRAGSQR